LVCALLGKQKVWCGSGRNARVVGIEITVIEGGLDEPGLVYSSRHGAGFTDSYPRRLGKNAVTVGCCKKIRANGSICVKLDANSNTAHAKRETICGVKLSEAGCVCVC